MTPFVFAITCFYDCLRPRPGSTIIRMKLSNTLVTGLDRTLRQTSGILPWCALLVVAWTAPVLAEPPASTDLRLVYKMNCVRCHGPDGTARDSFGDRLAGQDFTDPRWRQRTPDDEMVATILKGKFFGWVMPAFKDMLTKEEAQRMVTEIIRTTVKGKTIEPPPQAQADKRGT